MSTPVERTREDEVFWTLASAGWTLDNGTDEQGTVAWVEDAEFWFDADGTPHLLFDDTVSGHLLDGDRAAGPETDARTILAELDSETLRWWNRESGCADPDHGVGDHPCDEVLGAKRAAEQRATRDAFDQASEADAMHPERWREGAPLMCDWTMPDGSTCDNRNGAAIANVTTGTDGVPGAVCAVHLPEYMAWAIRQLPVGGTLTVTREVGA